MIHSSSDSPPPSSWEQLPDGLRTNAALWQELMDSWRNEYGFTDEDLTAMRLPVHRDHLLWLVPLAEAGQSVPELRRWHITADHAYLFLSDPGLCTDPAHGPVLYWCKAQSADTFAVGWCFPVVDFTQPAHSRMETLFVGNTAEVVAFLVRISRALSSLEGNAALTG